MKAGVSEIPECKVFTIDFQLVGTSYIYDGAKVEEFGDVDKLLKKIELLPVNCVVLAEMGGAVDPVVLTVADRGIEVWTVPATHEQKARDEFGFSAKRSEDSKVLFQMFSDEKWRKLFYRHETADASLLELTDAYATYTKLIRDRVALQNAITSTYRRAAIRGRKPNQSVAEYVKEKSANNPAFAATTGEEKEYLEKVDLLVKSRPEYKKFLAPIAGVGPRIAAGILTGIRKANRFVASEKPAFKITRERCLEYCGLGGQAITDDFVASRRASKTADVGVPQLKADLFLLADQFNRQADESPMKQLLNVHRLKAWTTMLDELLNSPERADVVFTVKGRNGEKVESISPRQLSHLRALRQAKISFIGDYYLPNLLSLEKGELTADFDANAELSKIVEKQIQKDKILIIKHGEFCLSRLPYKKGGPVPYGNWICFASFESPTQLTDAQITEQKILNGLKSDVSSEINDIRQKLEAKKADPKSSGESFEQLQAAFGRRQMRLEILQDSEMSFAEKVQLLRDDEMQIKWQARGIGCQICDLVREQTDILSRELKQIAKAESRLVAPFRKFIDELNKKRKELEVRESELKAKMRETQRAGDAAEVRQIQFRIENENNPERLVEIRKAVKDCESIIKDIRGVYNEIRDHVLKQFKPDIEAVLKDDPRCQGRSARDSKYIRQIISDIIVHCAVKGLSI